MPSQMLGGDGAVKQHLRTGYHSALPAAVDLVVFEIKIGFGRWSAYD